MKLNFVVNTYPDKVTLTGIPIGRAFQDDEYYYIRLGLDIFLKGNGNTYSAKYFTRGDYTLLPEGTTVTITT